MKITKHMKTRMNQRAINQDLVNLTLDYGETMPDGKVVLSKKAIKIMLDAVENFKRKVQTAYKKRGVIVVADGETLITTYSLDSYKKGKVRKTS